MTEQRRGLYRYALPALAASVLFAILVSRVFPALYDFGLLGAAALWIGFMNVSTWSVPDLKPTRLLRALGGVGMVAVIAWLLWPLTEPS